jgi:hypothetical protein
MADPGHSSTQLLQALQRSNETFNLLLPFDRAAVGHTETHFVQWVHFSASYPNWGWGCCDSGLQHHVQLNGQPFRNTVVRIPGPS